MADTNKALQGALTGAGTGAAIGAVGGPVGMAIGAGVGGLAGALPGMLSDDPAIAQKQIAEAEAKARAMQQKALEDILSIPNPELQELKLEQYKQAGIITPETEQAITQDPSFAPKEISLDPRLRQARMDQLSTMQQLGKTAFTPEEKLALEDTRQKQVRDIQAAQQSVLQNRQMRGLGGSGDELAAALQAAQTGADTAHRDTMQTAALANQRALQAMSTGANLAGNIEQGDYERAKSLQDAQREFNRFDVQNQIGVQQRNVGRSNEAQYANLGSAQDIANKNIGQNLAAQQYANQQKQNQFSNLLGKASQAQGATRDVTQGLMGQAAGGRADQAAANEQFKDTLGGVGRSAMGVAEALKNTPKTASSVEPKNTEQSVDTNLSFLDEEKAKMKRIADKRNPWEIER